MRSLRWLLSITLAVYMTGASSYALAQDADTSLFSITLAPAQFADVKGNVGKFEALNWMPSGENAGVSDISFVKDINKDIFLDVDGSVFPKTDDGTGHLTLKDGDLAFLKIDYNAFRKYYDDTGGVYPYSVIYNSNGTNYGKIPWADQGAKANSPDLQMDISYFKLEAGIGPITDPFLDVAYEHNSKNGDKSLLQWTSAYTPGNGTTTNASRKIGPDWESVNDTVDRVTLKENKEIPGGITIKGEQNAEVDYNNDISYNQFLNNSYDELTTENESPDAKLFGVGLRLEKWTVNDNTFAALGYHYNHTSDTDLMQTQVFGLQESGTLNAAGVFGLATSGSGTTSSTTTLWNFSKAAEDDHVWVGNLNTNLTPNLDFLADARYEHMGSEGDAVYYPANSSGIATATDMSNMQNHEDQEGEHLALRYSGIPHTSLYAESEMEQENNWVYESYAVVSSPASEYTLDRLDRSQSESWTVGGRIVPDRFFTFTTEVKQHSEANIYDTISGTGSFTGLLLLDSDKQNGVEESSTLTWRPYHWLQNSLKYQFYDTVYNPRPTEGSTPGLPISENHMLTSQFTYDISVQPIDPLLLMITYSHVENYVRTLAASEVGTNAYPYIPDFNSGDNSWLFSSSYSPTENLVWTNTACYTLSDNYVDFASGLPLGTDFRELSLTTSLDWSYHKWLKIGPSYEHASYRDNTLSGGGNYSANIFMLQLKFNW